MKNSSDFTRDILTMKNHKDISPCDNFIPYLVQKYISGVSPEHCNLVNSILNGKLSHWNDDQEIYDYLKCFIPKKSNAYYKYFGKPASKKKDHNVDIKSIAYVLEVPEHEVIEMLENFPELEGEMEESKEKILKSKK